MAKNADQRRRGIASSRHGRLIVGVTAGCVLIVAAVMALQVSGRALAQDSAGTGQGQPPGSVDPAQAATDPAQPTTDPITNEQIELLQESGLIEQQSKLSEGLLIMDRQLRQAQLVGQLLEVLGPEAKIEVTPGEFKSFANTPAGLQGRIEYLKLLAELDEARTATGGLGGFDSFSGTGVTEIYGKSGDLNAVISLNGEQWNVSVGDQLDDGTQILSITADRVEVQDPDGTVRVFNSP